MYASVKKLKRIFFDYMDKKKSKGQHVVVVI